MKKTIVTRINEYLQANKISRLQFSAKIGANPTTINKQLKGDSALPYSTVEAFIDAYPVNIVWLLQGVGPMDVNSETETPATDFALWNIPADHPAPVQYQIAADRVADVPARPSAQNPENMSISEALQVIRSQQQIIENQAKMLEHLVKTINNPNNK